MRNADAEPMPAIVGSESEQVGEHQDACWRRKGGFQHQGPLHVSAAACPLPTRRDAPVAGIRTEQPAEYRGRVEAREGQPFDGSFSVDQGA